MYSKFSCYFKTKTQAPALSFSPRRPEMGEVTSFFFGLGSISTLRRIGNSTDANARHPASRTVNVSIASNATYGTVLFIFRCDGEYFSLPRHEKCGYGNREDVVACSMLPRAQLFKPWFSTRYWAAPRTSYCIASCKTTTRTCLRKAAVISVRPVLWCCVRTAT
jgi:hypothetical protein